MTKLKFILIVCEGYILRRTGGSALGCYKGMYPETNTLPKQHTSPDRRSGFRARLLIVFFCLLIAACSTVYKNLTAEMPDLSPIADGVYRGNYDLSGTPVAVTLDVIMQDKKIIKIEIVKHFCSPIGKKAERIIDRITNLQSLDVDVISGATASSKAILKAVENALQ